MYEHKLGQFTFTIICEFGQEIKNSLVMWRGSAWERHHGGMSVTRSMIDLKRFKIGLEDIACHLALLIVL